jgi:DNA helicase IV
MQELQRLFDREDISPRQVAVIGPAAKGRGSLADVDEVAGVPVVTSASVWRSGGGLLITTARSFKGLEADVVLIYDLNDFGEVFRKEDLYVACTRAKVLLIAVVHGEECRSVVQQAFVASGRET